MTILHMMRPLFLLTLFVLTSCLPIHAATIAGRVINRADGKPVSGISVGAQGAGVTRGGGGAVTNAEGGYEIKDLKPGNYNVALDIKDGLEKDYTARARENLYLEKDGRREGVDFELIPGVVITGRVTAEDNGEALSGVSIGVYGPAHPKTSPWVQATLTDANGVYSLRVPEGKHYVYLQGSPPLKGFDSPLPAYKNIEIKEGKTISVDFKLPKMIEQNADDGGLKSRVKMTRRKPEIKIQHPEFFEEVADARPVLKWEAMDEAVQYSVTWSNSTSPEKQESDEEEVFVSKNEFSFAGDLQPQTRYRWQVRAYDNQRRQIGESHKAYFLTPGASAVFQEERRWVEDRKSVLGSNIFGVYIGDPVDPAGLLVASVAKGSPAQEAGVARVDVLLEINGTALKGLSPLGFIKLIAAIPTDKEVPLLLLRNGERLELKVKLRERVKTNGHFP